MPDPHKHDHGHHSHGHEHRHTHGHDPAHHDDEYNHEHGHSHEHVHYHSHEHDHDQGSGHHHHEQDHDHAHEHGGGHEHEHGAADRSAGGEPAAGALQGGASVPADLKKTAALLDYMLGHNRDHAGELAGMAKKLQDANLAAAAALVEEGVKQFEKGNAALEAALKKIRG